MKKIFVLLYIFSLLVKANTIYIGNLKNFTYEFIKFNKRIVYHYYNSGLTAGHYHYNYIFYDSTSIYVSSYSDGHNPTFLTDASHLGYQSSAGLSVNVYNDTSCTDSTYIIDSKGKCSPLICTGANMHADYNLKKCVCNDGYALDQNGSSCSCYVGAAQYTYPADQSTCSTLDVIKISDLEALYQFSWNSCLNECTAQSVPLCDKGYIYNDYGQCVPAILDASQCAAQGGTLQNERITENSTCVEVTNNGTNVISPCCEKVADCVDSSGNIIASSSQYVQCGVSLDINTTDQSNKCTTCTGDTPVATDDGYCTNSDQTQFSNCPNPANQCPNCPADYPIPNDSGNCLNSSGAFTACPAFQNENNNSTPIDTTPKCQTCGLLQGGWIQGENGQCKRVTASGVVQYAACPATPESNNTTDVNPNPRPDQNSTFSDSNNSIAPTLGNNSGTDTDSNGTKQVRICNTCPSGYTNVNGICALVSTNGTIVSTTPCPTPVETKDSNSSDPLDANGSDKNVTGIANELGKVGADQIKKAYKAYNIFPTQCGQLQPMTDVKFFGGKVTIKDPLPAFRDILEPFRDMISNILLFIAAVIGLFDFFRRN